MLAHFFLQRAPDPVWLLESGVLPNKELDALVFEFIVHHALVVASHSDCPLFQLAKQTLPALLGHSRDVRLRPGVLHAQLVSVVYKNPLELVECWPGWSTREYRGRIRFY